MTGAISAGVIVAVVAGIYWARAVAARADRRSIDNYQRVRGVIGSVARRSEQTAPVAAPSQAEVARPHVRLEEDDELGRVDRPMTRPPVPPRIVLEPADIEHAAALPVFGETDLHPSPAGAPPTRDNRHRPRRRRAPSRGAPTKDSPASGEVPLDTTADSEARRAPIRPAPAAAKDSDRSLRSSPERRRPSSRRPLVLVAAVVVAGAGVGAWQLSTNNPAPSRKSAAGSGVKSKVQPTVSTVPVLSTVEPTLVSANVVSFKAPTGPYTLSFTADNQCWLGFESSVNGPYLSMTTLGASGTTQYRANGPIVVRIGAPQYVHLALNGVAVALPSNKVTAYDAVFSSTSSALP